MSAWRPTATQTARVARAQLLGRLRAHFADAQVLEVETPMLSAAGTTDPNIDSAAVTCGNIQGYLHTSPEFAMKRLIADGCGDCYQIARVFRAGERGRRHNPEFTMLEWYRLGFTLADISADLQTVLNVAFERQLSCDRWTFQSACRELGGFDSRDVDVAHIQARLQHAKQALPVGLTESDTDGWLDYAFSALVAPAFSPDGVTLVSGYPPSQASLAAMGESDDGPVALRVEAYFGQLELANGFEELRDATEQRTRFESEYAQRQQSGCSSPPVDAHLLAALAHGLPACSGMAVGLDRVLMVLLGETCIEAVVNFPWGRA